MNVTILIPSYKEKKNLEKLIPILYNKVYKKGSEIHFSTLIVDDNSPDGTREILDKFLRTYPHLFVSYGEKRGIGAAMKRGYTYAMQNLTPDAIVTYEADFVFAPETILALIDKLSQADVVLASRLNVSLFYSSSQLRLLGHFFANTVICEWVAGMNQVHEHTAAGRAIRVPDILDQIDLTRLPNGYAFFPATLYSLAQKKSRFCELSVVFSERTVGKSKLNPTNLVQMIRELYDSLNQALLFRLFP